MDRREGDIPVIRRDDNLGISLRQHKLVQSPENGDRECLARQTRKEVRPIRSHVGLTDN